MKLERIYTLRIKHGLSQTELAQILHISPRTYSHYETGTRNIPIETLIALCDYYHVSVDYIVGRSNYPYVSR